MTGAMTGVRRFAQWGLWFGGALVLLAAVLIGIDVLMRKFLDRSIGGADELAGYSLAIGTTWGLGAALLDRAHIRIDSLYVLFPQKLRLVLDTLAIVLFVGFFALTLWHGLGVVSQSWSLGVAQPVGARNADRDPADTVDRRPRRLRRGERRAAGPGAQAGCGGRSARHGEADQHALGRRRGRRRNTGLEGSPGPRRGQLTCWASRS